MEPTTPAEPLNYQSPPPGLVRIGFPMRIVAAIIDVIIASVGSTIVGVILVFALTWIAGHLFASIVSHFVALGLVLAYFGMEVVKAQSVAKMIFKFRITAQDGSPASQDQLVKRYLFKQIPTFIGLLTVIPIVACFVLPVVLLAWLGLIASTLMVLNPEVLAFHDKMFKTAVYGPATPTVAIPQVQPATAPPAGTPPPVVPPTDVPPPSV